MYFQTVGYVILGLKIYDTSLSLTSASILRAYINLRSNQQATQSSSQNYENFHFM